MSLFLISACGSTDDEFYRIEDYETIGVIKDYKQGGTISEIKKLVLNKYLPNSNSYVAFCDVIVLGEKENKIYTLNTCAYYDKVGRQVFENTEEAEFENFNDVNYKSIDVFEDMFNMNFLPEDIEQELRADSEVFEWRVYYTGKSEEKIRQEAKEYFH
ncbi:MAG: hypothetical protein J1F01_00270 [Oscillospiraceae bacterium]|nr:hypothetical protein [Oscillospiraceae bacterium]